mmetsp:Transcript_8180/g.23507  ORF Transcript_8180/g.23507 Transcript_8180/m.23507 type:complete len:203 (+) Transcript_8180:107-715(+)
MLHPQRIGDFHRVDGQSHCLAELLFEFTLGESHITSINCDNRGAVSVDHLHDSVALGGFDRVANTGPSAALGNHGCGIGLVGFRLDFVSESGQNTVNDLLEIESVEMQVLDADFNQLLAHLHTVRDTERLEGIGIILHGIHLCLQLCRHTRFAKLGHLAESGVCVDADDSRNDRAVDAPFFAVLDELPEDLRVEEHLCDDEV